MYLSEILQSLLFMLACFYRAVYNDVANGVVFPLKAKILPVNDVSLTEKHSGSADKILSHVPRNKRACSISARLELQTN